MAHFDIGNRLAIYGWAKDTEEFFYIIATVWYKGYHPLAPSEEPFAQRFRNVEQLLFHAEEALNFCIEVRQASKLTRIPTNEILQTLNNLRKNKYLEGVKDEFIT